VTAYRAAALIEIAQQQIAEEFAERKRKAESERGRRFGRRR